MSYNEIGFSAVFLITDQEMQTTKKTQEFLGRSPILGLTDQSITPKLIY